jgi:hypothetical protein
MKMLVNEQVSGLETGKNIGVLELNTNLKKIGSTLKRPSTEWIKDYMGTS